MTRCPGRWVVLLGYVAWVGSVLYVVAVLAWPSVATCELIPGTSISGEASRSLLPPGTTCTYDLEGYATLVLSPSPLRLVIVAAALVGLPVLRYLSRLLRSTTPREAPVAAV